jgi:hypothetical protein
MILKVVEEMIQEAIARGKFDNLPGAGKPLDMDAYFALPEEDRLAYTALKNAGYVPDEVGVLREIKLLRDQLALTHDDERKRALHKRIDEKTLKFNLMIEQRQNARRKARKFAP